MNLLWGMMKRMTALSACRHRRLFHLQILTVPPCLSSVVPQRIVNNNAFSHASSVSGFQPFVRPKAAHIPELGCAEQKNAGDRNSVVASSSKLSDIEEKNPASLEEKNPASLLVSDSVAGRDVEREEGEWLDDDGAADTHRSSSLHEPGKASRGKGMIELEDSNASGVVNEREEVT